MHARESVERQSRDRREKKERLSFVVPLPSRAFSHACDHLRFSGVFCSMDQEKRETARRLTYCRQLFLILKKYSGSRQKEKFVLTLSIKLSVLVVLWRQRKYVQKSVMQVRSCCLLTSTLRSALGWQWAGAKNNASKYVTRPRVISTRPSDQNRREKGKFR